jgi:uncharacterized protein YraI
MTRVMTKQRLILAVLVSVWLICSIAWAETLYVQRPKVDIKGGRGAFFPTVHAAKKGDQLQVLGKEEGWYKVQTPQGPGWVFETAVAGKAPGINVSSFTGTADSSELDKTAGFKGFDAPTEQAYVSAHNLQREIAMVSRLEKVPFTVQELSTFQKQGQVGPMGGAQ